MNCCLHNSLWLWLPFLEALFKHGWMLTSVMEVLEDAEPLMTVRYDLWKHVLQGRKSILNFKDMHILCIFLFEPYPHRISWLSLSIQSYGQNSTITNRLNIHVKTSEKQPRIYISLMVDHSGSECLDRLLISLRNDSRLWEPQAWDIPTTPLIQLVQKLPPWWKRCLLPGMTLSGCWLCNLALHNNSMAKSLSVHTCLLYAGNVDTLALRQIKGKTYLVWLVFDSLEGTGHLL